MYADNTNITFSAATINLILNPKSIVLNSIIYIDSWLKAYKVKSQ